MKAFIVLVSLFGLFAVQAEYVQLMKEDGQGEKSMSRKTIETVLKERTKSLMSLPGVVGTAQGECKGQPCIRVFVVKKTPNLLKLISPEIQGYEVVIQETGDIRALKPNQ